MIAYLLKKFPRLSETFVLNEILGQESLGRDLHVFSRREPDEEPRHPELQALRADSHRHFQAALACGSPQHVPGTYASLLQRCYRKLRKA